MESLTTFSPQGMVTISPEVVATIAAETATKSYGVVALATGSRLSRLAAGRNGFDRTALGRLLGRLLPPGSVSVAGDVAGLRVGLRVIVEHGLNLAEVAAAVRAQVGYEVERLTGLPVAAVEVVVHGVQVGT